MGTTTPLPFIFVPNEIKRAVLSFCDALSLADASLVSLVFLASSLPYRERTSRPGFSPQFSAKRYKEAFRESRSEGGREDLGFDDATERTPLPSSSSLVQAISKLVLYNRTELRLCTRYINTLPKRRDSDFSSPPIPISQPACSQPSPPPPTQPVSAPPD